MAVVPKKSSFTTTPSLKNFSPLLCGSTSRTTPSESTKEIYRFFLFNFERKFSIKEMTEESHTLFLALLSLSFSGEILEIFSLVTPLVSISLQEFIISLFLIMIAQSLLIYFLNIINFKIANKIFKYFSLQFIH